MKNKSLLSFYLMLISSTLLFSQSNYKKGYIIKGKDTIHGEIDYRNDKTLSEICRFKIGDDIKEYAPFEIDTYRFKGDRLFISKEIERKKVFLEVLIKGKLSVFSYSEIIGKPRYFISNEKHSLKEITYPEEDVARSANNYLARLNQHIALLNAYTLDVPSLQSKIRLIKEPNRKNLIKLAETYHNKVCDTEKCIVYKSKTRRIKVLTEFRLGLKNYTNKGVSGFQLTKKSFFKIDGLIYFSMPYLGDEWFLKTGASFYKQEYSKIRSVFRVDIKDKIVVQVPVQFQYIKASKIVQPKLSYGFLFGSSFTKEEKNDENGDIRSNLGINILMGAGVGVNIKIAKKMFVSISSDFEFGRNFILPTKLYSTNLTGGLVYQF